MLLAQLRERLGDTDSAAKAFDQCYQEYPDNEDVVEECSRFHFLNVDWIKSKKFLTSLVNFAPNNAAALHNLGSVLLHLGENEEAIAALKKSLELRPESEMTKVLVESAMQAT